MSHDIGKLLQDWPYDPQDTIRIIAAEDGRSVLQVRLPLGIEQYELDGRPDGKLTGEYDTYLDTVLERLQQHIVEHAVDTGFVLSQDDLRELQTEGVLVYYRYLMLFQIAEYSRVERDTEHNLRVCELLEQYSSDQDTAHAVLQFKPYIVRMHAMARVMQHVQLQQGITAVEIVQGAIDTIEAMAGIESPAFEFEKIRSLKYLYSVRKQLSEIPITPNETSSQIEKLRAELGKAVEEENYERAAELRDRLRRME